MNQSAASQPSRKKAVFSLLILLALTCVIVLIFRDHWAEITAALAQLNLWQVLVVLALGISYPLLEGCVSYVIVRGRLPGFTLRQGIDNAWCGTFGNVVTLGAAHWPRRGPDDPAICVPQDHGAAVRHRDAAAPAQMAGRQHHRRAEISAHGICCGSAGDRGAGAGVRVAAGAESGPLGTGLFAQDRKMAAAPGRLDVLGTESRLLLADKARCVQIFALQALKLFLLFCLPWLCIRFMQLSPLSFARVQLLTSLMLFVSNALPNVAGMGSIETAFLLLYSSFLPSGEVMSVLMLYRIASYYFVFAASAVGFFLAQRRLTRTPPKEA